MARTHRRGLRRTVAAFGLALAATLLLGVERPLASRAADEAEILRILDQLPTSGQDWTREWMSSSTEGDARSIDAMLQLSKKLDRGEIKQLVGRAPEKYRALANNLDVARHQYVKRLVARSVAEANRRLAGKRPVSRALTVNAGGTGDFTRDQDITVFGGDALREKTLFECMRDQLVKDGVVSAAEAAGMDVRSGINVERLEVSFHRGGNSLPDPRFATDVQSFALEYARVINAQARNPEAYYGLAYEQEVAGRQYLTFKPGTTYVQSFDADGAGKVSYTGHLARSTAEVRAHLRGAVDQRWRRSQYATHMAADYFQAVRHEQGEHGGGDLTKGALKYAGRALDALLAFDAIGREDRGSPRDAKPVWIRTGKETGPILELTREDKIELLRGVMPDKSDALLQSVSESLDVAAQVFANKADPVKALHLGEDAARDHAKIALIFLRHAVASTTEAVALEMLDPPPFEARWVQGYDDPHSPWHQMTPEQQAEHLRRSCETYRRATSVAAMENLLTQMFLLRQLDRPEHNPKGTTAGHDAIARMIERASPRAAPLLRVAAEYANGLMAFEHGGRAETRLWGYKRMVQCQRILREAAGINEGPTVVERLTNLSLQDYRKKRQEKQTFWPPAADELKEHLRTIVEDAFPPTDLAGAKQKLREHGVKGYLAGRAVEELGQPSNVSDLLTLVEMYQEDATSADLLKFAGTNLVSRTHWSVGFFIQAAEVHDEASLKDLGKNLVFDALARLVPPAATAKLAFDIERGIVVTTVGYTLDQLNDALVDAVYTGEAGRLNDALSGHNAGKIRDAVSPVCPAPFVLKVPEVDPKTEKPTGKTRIAIDRAGLYLHYLRQWGGTDDYDQEPSVRPPYSGRQGAFLKANDRAVQAMSRAAEKAGPTWFGSSESYVSDTEVHEALAAFRTAVEKEAREVVNASLTEIVVREFHKGGKNVIEEGLVRRLADDVLCGLMDRWQTDRRARASAFGEAVDMAAMADLSAVAKALQASAHGGAPGADADAVAAWYASGENAAPGAKPRPTPSPAASLAPARLDLVVKPLGGEAGSTIDAFDSRVPFTAQLVDQDGKPIDSPLIRVTLKAGPVSPVNPGETVKAGTLVRHDLTATAVDAAGKTVATKTIEVRVHLPDDPLGPFRDSRSVTVLIEGHRSTHAASPSGESRDDDDMLEECEVVRLADQGKNGQRATLAWSGNSFSAEWSLEKTGGSLSKARERPLDWKPGATSSETASLSIKGTYDPKARTMSFTLTKKRRSFGAQEFRNGEVREKDADGHEGKVIAWKCAVTDMTIVEQLDISAQNLPASGRGFEVDGDAAAAQQHGAAYSWKKETTVVSRATENDKTERGTNSASAQFRGKDRWRVGISFSKSD